jgi:hypothetical protein
LPNRGCIFILIETIAECIVSSGRWGEDGDYGLAEAVHFHVATSALIVLNLFRLFFK